MDYTFGQHYGLRRIDCWGKVVGLARLKSLGLPVPDAFCVAAKYL